MDWKDIAKRLRLMRHFCLMTGADLAEASGIGIRTISTFESGRRTSGIRLRQMVALTRACGFTVAEFLAWRPNGKEIAARWAAYIQTTYEHNGAKRKEYCSRGHLMAESRRTKIYVTKKGEERVVSGGCLLCSKTPNKPRLRRKHEVQQFQSHEEENARMDRIALQMMGREA